MLHHFTLYGGMRPTILVDKAYFVTTMAGWVGVDLFFVLSGFLITGILLDAKGRSGYFRSFYMRRLLRIFPLYYGVLFGCFVVLPHLVSPGSSLLELSNEQDWYWSYLLNWHIAFNGWPPLSALGHFWSLAVEEQFYLIWPVIIVLVRRRTLAYICLALIIGSFSLRVGLIWSGNSLAAYVLTLARMDTLAVGALLAVAMRDPRAVTWLSQWMWMAAAISALILSVIIVWHGKWFGHDSVIATIGYTLQAWFFGAILSIAILSPPQHLLSKGFASPILVFFGHYSYGLYVFHHLIVFGMRHKGFTIELFPRYMDSQLPGLLLYIIVATAVSLCLALLSWHLYEAQFLKLKRFFPYSHSMDTSKTGSWALDFSPKA
jgi:peptidoglycan/LPS O-acetylase OafA/YrhL